MPRGSVAALKNAWCKSRISMADPHMTPTVLERRQRAIAACATQMVFGVVSASLAYDRDAISGMVFGPIFTCLAACGLYGAVFLRSWLILAHFMLVCGAVIMAFVYISIEFFALGDDDTDELMLITSIPLVCDVCFACFSGHLYWAYAAGAAPPKRQRLLSQGSVRSTLGSFSSSVPEGDRPPCASPVMPGRIEVSVSNGKLNSDQFGSAITG